MHYFILSVSKNRAQLYEVNGDQVIPRVVEHMPTSMADAWKGTERHESMMQTHSSGDGASMFHGQGGAKDVEEQEEDQYLHALAKSLHKLLHGQHLPLVFAGVAEEFGMFRTFDKSGVLLDEYIRGNPDQLRMEELKEKADPLVREHTMKKNEHFIEEYGALIGTGRTSTDIAEIVHKANSGKVDLLLIAEGTQQWGVYDDAAGTVTVGSQGEAGAEELVGLASAYTAAHHGRIAMLQPDKMPEKATVAAILRY